MAAMIAGVALLDLAVQCCWEELEVRKTFIELRSERQSRPAGARRRCSSEPPQSVRDHADDECNSPSRCCAEDASPKSRPSEGASTDDAASASGTVCSSGDSVEPPPSPHHGIATSAAAAPEMKRSPLSSKAKAWQPPAQPDAAPFDTEARAILDAVVMGARTAGLISRSELAWDTASTHCSVNLAMATQEAGRVEHLLMLLKNALLQAAAGSTMTTVMGYGAAPFVPTADGFSAMLGKCERADLACWDAYCQGFCRRGNSCPWKHPRTLLQVDFHIAFGQLAPTAAVCAVAMPWAVDGPAAPVSGSEER
mmetsp:Transcript_44285/g.128054  ORF Transcript_44285/g.128054 Transcript_44285/m.128054 type:complete len:310 (-) Transcript_44285:55-984(-)